MPHRCAIICPMSRKFPRYALLSIVLFLHGCFTPRPPQPPTKPVTPSVLYEAVAWDGVDGWKDDQVQESWGAFLNSCKAIAARPDWTRVCTAAQTSSGTRQFFEANFTPYRIVQTDGQTNIDSGLITGYYEPLLHGSRQPSAAFPVALYAPPDDLLTVELGDLYPELAGKRVR